MKCFIIPDKLLEDVGDKRSIQISKKIRDSRNRLIRFLAGLGKKAASAVKLANRKTYSCNHKTELPGTLVHSEADAPHSKADSETQIAHEWTKVIRDFYWTSFERDSIDGKGMDLVSSVHYDKDYNNAFWNGSQMCYGDGDGKFFLPLCRSLDVAGHEITHGVIERTCGLYYFSQSGAANESFADKFGITIKHFYKKQSDPRNASWLLGEEIAGPDFPGVALRSFKNEKAYNSDPQPKHMNKYYRGFQDNGGVHINSGILNHAFYLYCLKLNESSYGRPIQIAYHAMSKLKAWSNFKAVAKAEIETAFELYGSWEADCVRLAYEDVGIKIKKFY